MPEQLSYRRKKAGPPKSHFCLIM